MVGVSQSLPLPPRGRAQVPWLLAPSPMWLLFLSVVFVAAAALLYLTQASRVVAVSYDISQLKRQREHLQEQRRQLSIQLAQAQTLARVEERARRQLALVHAQEEVFVPAGSIQDIDVEAAIRAGERVVPTDPETWRQRLGALLSTAGASWKQLRAITEPRPPSLVEPPPS